jgi:hypothetical protein
MNQGFVNIIYWSIVVSSRIDVTPVEQGSRANLVKSDIHASPGQMDRSQSHP